MDKTETTPEKNSPTQKEKQLAEKQQKQQEFLDQIGQLITKQGDAQKKTVR